MANWIFKVKIKHLFTEKEDYESIQKSMNSIAETLKKEPFFKNFRWLKKFNEIPKRDDVIDSVDYANKLINRMYDYADSNRIWIE